MPHQCVSSLLTVSLGLFLLLAGSGATAATLAYDETDLQVLSIARTPRYPRDLYARSYRIMWYGLNWR
jgi:hypothetical protein